MKRIAEIVPHPFSVGKTLNVAVDVSMDELHFRYDLIQRKVEKEIANRTEPINLMLTTVWATAKQFGHNHVHLVVESTSVYHKLLLRLAKEKGMKTSLVDTAAVKAIRKVIFGDTGKTDKKDPVAILELANRNHVLKDRLLPEIFQLGRRYNVVYDTAEKDMIRAKCRIHKCLKVLFPDLDFSKGYEYSNSGGAIMKAYGFNPHAIVRAGRTRVHKKLKRLVPRMRNSTITRLMKYAKASVLGTPAGRLNQVLADELKHAWEDMVRFEERRNQARLALESLYDEACLLDPNLPKPAKGFASKLNLARFFSETGPLTDFASWRQLMKYAGLNLCERQSGNYKGVTRIGKNGRKLIRKILQQMILSLVKKNGLFGPYYHHKRHSEKVVGAKAMTNVSRKFLKAIWGIYKSGGEFIAERISSCESQFALAA